MQLGLEILLQLQGICFVFSGAEIPPHSQWNLGDFLPIFLKKIPIFKKIFFLKIGIFMQSTHTHKLHGDVLLQFNGNSMCKGLFVVFNRK